MTLFTSSRGASRTRAAVAPAATLVAMTSVGLLIALAGSAQAATPAPPLGTADSFAVLAGAGVTNTGPTTLSGDLGSYPTLTITGDASIVFASGVNHAGDAVTQGAQTDLTTAYDAAAGAGPTSPITADLAGMTLIPGVYASASSMGLSGEVTLDAGGDPAAVFIFQVASTLTTAPGSHVTLAGGAQACNVFWQVGSSATLDTNSVFRGTVLAMTSITANTGATIEGRLLARSGAVTLDTNTVTRPSCATVPTAAATVAAAAAAPQVTAVPSGPVSTGDGSTAPGATTGGAGYLGAGAAVLALGVAALVVTHRRRVNV
ncbi:MAG TPA: ice-binding family protein [Cellulomonas sp.]|uniref:ice-binding family protein n=1 Tax=Cellulomonas sp. TaxID=40001 RepID=UPI002E359C68|nr:ice-binding family protein [Cellulomonas sp.]HEX5332549.1 ice-binding family protein [Cellulomonas sp.]